MNTPKYRLRNKIGNWMGGFDTREEAEASLPYMREDFVWKIENYIPGEDEINYYVK